MSINTEGAELQELQSSKWSGSQLAIVSIMLFYAKQLSLFSLSAVIDLSIYEAHR